MNAEKLNELIDKVNDGFISKEEELKLLQAIKDGAIKLSEAIDEAVAEE